MKRGVSEGFAREDAPRHGYRFRNGLRTLAVGFGLLATPSGVLAEDNTVPTYKLLTLNVTSDYIETTSPSTFRMHLAKLSHFVRARDFVWKNHVSSSEISFQAHSHDGTEWTVGYRAYRCFPGVVMGLPVEPEGRTAAIPVSPFRYRFTDSQDRLVPVTFREVPLPQGVDYRLLIIRRRDAPAPPLALKFPRNVPGHFEIVGWGLLRFILTAPVLSMGPGPQLDVFTPLGIRVLAPGKSDAEAVREAIRLARLQLPGYGEGVWTRKSSGERRRTVFEVKADEIRDFPLPPLALLALARGCPVTVTGGEVVTTGCLTRWGPYRYIRGKTLRISLPVRS